MADLAPTREITITGAVDAVRVWTTEVVGIAQRQYLCCGIPSLRAI